MRNGVLVGSDRWVCVMTREQLPTDVGNSNWRSIVSEIVDVQCIVLVNYVRTYSWCKYLASVHNISVMVVWFTQFVNSVAIITIRSVCSHWWATETCRIQQIYEDAVSGRMICVMEGSTQDRWFVAASESISCSNNSYTKSRFMNIIYEFTLYVHLAEFALQVR